MTDNNTLREALKSLPVRTEIVNVDTGERGRQSIELPLDLRDALIAALSTPLMKDIQEHFDLAHGLIQEAKGAGNGFVVDHLDAAEGHLDKIEAVLALSTTLPDMKEGEAISDTQIKHMVERFLQWKLPENFAPDAGISFKAEYNDSPKVMAMLGIDKPMRHEPVGTNLFDYTQAEAMVRHMLEGMAFPDMKEGELILEARNLVETTVHWSPQTDRDLQAGKNDGSAEMKIAIAALKRGMTLAAASPPDVSSLLGMLREWLSSYEGWSEQELARRVDPATIKRIRQTRTALNTYERTGK